MKTTDSGVMRRLGVATVVLPLVCFGAGCSSTDSGESATPPTSSQAAAVTSSTPSTSTSSQASAQDPTPTSPSGRHTPAAEENTTKDPMVSQQPPAADSPEQARPVAGGEGDGVTPQHVREPAAEPLPADSHDGLGAPATAFLIYPADESNPEPAMAAARAAAAQAGIPVEELSVNSVGDVVLRSSRQLSAEQAESFIAALGAQPSVNDVALDGLVQTAN